MNKVIPVSLRKPDKDPTPMGKFGVFDIEAHDWINFLGLVAYSEDPYVQEIFHHKNNQRPKHFIEWLFSENNNIDIWFAHFGGGYDFLFILKDVGFFPNIYVDNMVFLGSSMLCLDLLECEEITKKDFFDKNLRYRKKEICGRYLKVNRTIKLKDSGKMLPFSLKNLANDFDVVHKKLDETVDVDNMTEWTKEVEKYCVYDCMSLYEVLEKYFNNDMIKKAGVKYTTASQSMAFFKTTLGDREIPNLSEKDDEFVRKSYFGGRTEIYKPVFDGNENNYLNYYDINSLYPSVMIDNEFAYRKSAKNIKEIDDRYISFFHCKVDIPKDLYIGPLPAKVEINKMRKTVFPVGEVIGHWSTIELENAMKYGVKILEVYESKTFIKGGKIFNDVISYLYKRRLEAGDNKVDNILTKLLMNSLYGKFGVNRHKENIVPWSPELFPDKYADYIIESDIGEIFLARQDVFLGSTFTNVAIAAQVTSYARARHFNDMMNLKDVYNTDTDSYWTTDTVETNTGLGGVKLEDKIQRACFLLPKTYAMDVVNNLESSTDTKTIVKMKGFSKEVREQFSYDDFVAALHGDMIRLKGKTRRAIMKPRAAMARGDFLKVMDESTKQIRSMYDKRKIIFKKNGDIDTEPLIIKGGEVVNK